MSNPFVGVEYWKELDRKAQAVADKAKEDQKLQLEYLQYGGVSKADFEQYHSWGDNYELSHDFFLRKCLDESFLPPKPEEPEWRKKIARQMLDFENLQKAKLEEKKAKEAKQRAKKKRAALLVQVQQLTNKRARAAKASARYRQTPKGKKTQKLRKEKEQTARLFLLKGNIQIELEKVEEDSSDSSNASAASDSSDASAASDSSGGK